MNDYLEYKLTREQAANAIERFALYHANGDLPRSELTVSALKMAVNELRQEFEPVVHGHWIKHFDDIWPEDSMFECSECHEEEYVTLNNTKRCPNCGAYMDSDKTADL